MSSRISTLIAAFLLAFMMVPNASAGSHGKKEILHGYLVDVACSQERAKELTTLGQVHSTQCLQMPGCPRSGYALLTAKQQIIKFDSTGNEQARKLISTADRAKDYRVVVSGRLEHDQLNVSQLALENP
jgi:hypothetical protein